MINCIIVEDEIDAQNLLSRIISEYCPDVSLLGIASDIENAKSLIKLHSPQLLFLDIQLQSETSFVLLDQINHENHKIIFTTAYEEYALKAYRYETIDYILKPYSPADIIDAIEKVKRNILLPQEIKEKESVTLFTQDGQTIVKIENIIRLKADRSYCMIYLTNPDRNILISKPLKEIAEQLPQNQFYRTHASHHINLDYVAQYANERGAAILTDGTAIPVSRRRKQDFILRLSQY